jgi:argininosuccinate lyase
MNHRRLEFSAFPHPVYLDAVLKPNFEHSVQHFFLPLIEINQAHAIMLTRRKIIPRRYGTRILRALRQLAGQRSQLQAYPYKGEEEDLFFYIEKRLEKLCGLQVAGCLSVARSRNDVDITLYRMVLRKELLETSVHVNQLQQLLLDLAERHLETIFPVVTHTQLAQPTTLAHYLMAAVEFLSRDLDRLFQAYLRVNQSPLGACVATTTGFPIDRKLLGELLGFSSVLENAYGCVASADYLIESVSALKVLMVDLGRLIQDLLSWSSQDSRLIRLADGFVQCSSIMPQKRNPAALEHLRVLASCALGQCQTVVFGLHNTPFGDIVDAEDDIQPSVRSAFAYGRRVLTLLTEVLRSVTVDGERALAKCREGEITLTELADWLVRRHDLPFRIAHRVVSHVAAGLRQHPARRKGESPFERISDLTTRFSKTILGQEICVSPRLLSTILDPAHFVKVRRVTGGPAPEQVKRSIHRYRKINRRSYRRLQEKTAALADYRKALE